MKTNNELIAEFMGLPLTKQELEFSGDRKFKTVPFQKWKYHESWDWLMPVVEKIESLGFIFTIHSDAGYIGKHWYKGNIPHFGNVSENKITATYNVVIQFINWYNENKN
jgi:predicted TIM-barrel fold metal-dependent hydrolase